MDAKEMLDRLGASAWVRTFANGERVFRRGDAARHMYGVLSGGACLGRDTFDGGRIVVHRAGPGSLFAEASLFSDVYHCDGEAVGDTVLAVYPKQAVHDLMAAERHFAHAFSRHLAGQVQRLRTQVELRTVRSAEERVLNALSLMSDGVGGTVTLSTTWKAFAHDIGLTHEALYRALSRLQRAGRIERDGRLVTLMGVGD